MLFEVLVVVVVLVGVFAVALFLLHALLMVARPASAFVHEKTPKTKQKTTAHHTQHPTTTTSTSAGACGIQITVWIKMIPMIQQDPSPILQLHQSLFALHHF